MAVLQLSSGSPTGRLRVYGLGAFRVSVLETAPRLFLSGQRRSDRFTLAFELGERCDLSDLRAQGTAMPCLGLWASTGHSKTLIYGYRPAASS